MQPLPSFAVASLVRHLPCARARKPAAPAWPFPPCAKVWRRWRAPPPRLARRTGSLQPYWFTSSRFKTQIEQSPPLPGEDAKEWAVIECQKNALRLPLAIREARDHAEAGEMDLDAFMPNVTSPWSPRCTWIVEGRRPAQSAATHRGFVLENKFMLKINVITIAGSA